MDVHLTYAKLVNDEGDMAGHVAYALYKRDKLKFIEAFRLEKGRHPSSVELEAFVVTANLALRFCVSFRGVISGHTRLGTAV